jgi:hypothetical protein
MNHSRLLRNVSACAIALSGCTATTVHPIVLDGTETKVSGVEGVFYSLPRTVIRVSLPTTTTTYSRGYLWEPGIESKLRNAGIDFPPQLEKLPQVTLGPRTGTPEITSRTIPDNNQVFLVEPKGGWLQDRSLLVELTDAGVITSGSGSVRDRTVEFAVKVIKAGVSAISAGLAPGVAPAPASSATSPAAPTRADEVIAEILALRSRRLDLVAAADAQMPRDTLERMLTQLDVVERQLIGNLFTTSVEDNVLSAEFDPEIGNLTYVLFPTVNCSIKVEYDGQESKRIAAVRNAAGIDPKASACSLTRGFYYRVPASCTVSVCVGSTVLANRTMPIAQLGAIAALPAGVSSTDIRTVAEFSSDSGALKKFEMESKSIDPALVDELSTSVNALASASAARSAAKAAEPGRLERLQAQLNRAKEILALFGVNIPGVGDTASSPPADAGGN